MTEIYYIIAVSLLGLAFSYGRKKIEGESALKSGFRSFFHCGISIFTICYILEVIRSIYYWHETGVIDERIFYNITIGSLFFLFLFITQLRENSWFNRRIFHNIHRKLILFFVAVLSLSVLFVYVYTKVEYCLFFEKWIKPIPESFIVLLLSLPVATIFWIWRNDDKLNSYRLECRNIQNNELIVHSNNMMQLMKIISENTESEMTKKVALEGLKIYALGGKGRIFSEQAVLFLKELYLKINMQMNRLDSPCSDTCLFKGIILILRQSMNQNTKNYKSFEKFNLSDFTPLMNIKYCEFKKCSFFGINLETIEISNSLFQECSFVEAKITGCRFFGCTFTACLFENCTISFVTFIDCIFYDTEICKAKFAPSNIFTNCMIKDKNLCSNLHNYLKKYQNNRNINISIWNRVKIYKLMKLIKK